MQDCDSGSWVTPWHWHTPHSCPARPGKRRTPGCYASGSPDGCVPCRSQQARVADRVDLRKRSAHRRGSPHLLKSSRNHPKSRAPFKAVTRGFPTTQLDDAARPQAADNRPDIMHATTNLAGSRKPP